MAQLDDQLATLRAQAQAAVQRGDIATANSLGTQAAQLRSQAGPTAAPAAQVSPPPPAPASPPAAPPLRRSGVPTALQPRDRTEQQLFSQAAAQRASGNATGYNHTIRLIAVHRVGQTQGNAGRSMAFGGGVLGPVADYLGAAYDTFLSGQSHGESPDFSTNLTDREAVRRQLAATHPVSSGAGTAATFIATAPLAAAAVPARIAGVTRLAATAAVQGAGMGATSGAEHAQEQNQSAPQAAATVAGETLASAAENAAGAWVLGHVGRVALGSVRALIGNFNPTARGFAALARTDAARGLGLSPANLLASANRLRAATGSEPSPMQIVADAGQRAGNPNSAATVGQLMSRSPRAVATIQAGAEAADAARPAQVAELALPGSTAQGARGAVSAASDQAFAHLNSVTMRTVGRNNPLRSLLTNPDVVRAANAAPPTVRARLGDAMAGNARLTGRDADLLRRYLQRGGVGENGLRYGNVQLGNQLASMIDSASNGRYLPAIAQHAENESRASIAQQALNGSRTVAGRVATNIDPALDRSIPGAPALREGMSAIDTSAQSVRDMARPRAPTPQAEQSAGQEAAAHTIAGAVVGHGGALAYRAARIAAKGIAGISNRQAESVANYLAAQGPDAVNAFTQRLQQARGTAQATAVVRDILARSALGLTAGAVEGEGASDNGAVAAPAAQDTATPTSLSIPSGHVTAADIPQSYIDAMTQRESGGKANASNPNSSAQGAHQFIQSTWLQTIRDHGPELGLGSVAKHIAANGSVDEPAMRERILALRNNAEISGLVVRALTADNANFLAGKLGRSPNAGELYAAHVLGPQGAYHLISAAQSNVANAAAIFPREAAANHNLFYQGRTPLSAAAVLAKLNV